MLDKLQIVNAVYKNNSKLGVIIPEFEDLAPGIHDIRIEVSFNG